MMITRWVLLGCAAMAALAASCGGEPPEPSGADAGVDAGTPTFGGADSDGGTSTEVSFSRDVQPILSVCTGCHAGVGSAGGLDLSSAKAYAELLDESAAASQVFGCSVTRRVTPNEPSASLLYLKITADLPAGCGSPMPSGNEMGLSNQKQVETIRRWIQQGAPNN